MNFKHSENESYSNEEKLALGELVCKYHEEYEAEIKRNTGKTKHDFRRKKHVPIKPKCGYLAKAVREFYTDLADAANNDPIFNKALKVASRAYEDLPKLRYPSLHPAKKARASGGGRKVKSPEV